MSTKVGSLTIDLNANTAQLELNVNRAKKSLDGLNKLDLGEARGAIMVLGEEIGVHLPRHVQAFVATLPGIAPLLGAAFPVLAVVAIGKAIFDATEKMQAHKAAVAEAASRGLELASSMQKQAQSLEITNLRLKDQISILQKNIPHNALAIAALEGKKAVDELVASLRKAVDEEGKLLETQREGFMQRLLYGDSGKNEIIDQAKSFQAQIDDIVRQRTVAANTGRDTSGYQAMLGQRLSAYRAYLNQQMAANESARRHDAEDAANTEKMFGRKTLTDAERLGMVEVVNQKYRERQNILQDLLILITGYGKAEQEQSANTGLSTAIAARQEADQVARIQESRMAANLHAKNLLPTAKDLAQAAEDEAHNDALTMEALRGIQGVIESTGAKQRVNDEQAQRRADKMFDLIRENQDAHTLLSTKIKDERGALDDINRSLTKQIALVRALDQQTLGGMAGSPEQKQAYQQAVTDYQNMKIRQLELEKKYDDDIAKTFVGKMKQMTQQWGDIQSQLGNAFQSELGNMNSSLSSFIVTGKANWYGLAQSALESIIKIGIQWVESHVLMAAINAMFGQQQVADDAEATATTITSNVVMAESAAGLAGANAMASAALIDPFIAPEIAALDYGIAQAFVADAAAARGAILPNREMLVHTHPQEMILPAHVSNHIMASVSAGAPAGGGNHFHFSPVVQAVDATGVDRMLSNHMDTFVKHLNSYARRRNIG